MVGRGWTQPGGRPHAEVEALRRAGRGGARRDALRDARALLASRQDAALRRRHHGGRASRAWCRRWKTRTRRSPGEGHARLRAAGHRGRRRRLRRGSAPRPCRPYPPRARRPPACDAQARGLGRWQGRACRAASPAAITGEAARERVHLMRAMNDAILTGIGTVLSDDPQLTCRLARHGASLAGARRARQRAAAAAEVAPCRDARRARSTGPSRARRRRRTRRRALTDLGVEVLRVPGPNGRLDLARRAARARRRAASRG